ncbi:hypothetical protein V6N13_089620 [Hibiscus sabdariffa]
MPGASSVDPDAEDKKPRAVGVGGIRWLMSMRLLWKLIRKYFGVILLHFGRRREIPAQRGVELGVIQPIVIGFTSHE